MKFEQEKLMQLQFEVKNTRPDTVLKVNLKVDKTGDLVICINKIEIAYNRIKT